MINKILKELDHMIKFQEKEIELDMQAEELEGKIYFETAKLLAYDEVARMIKKCAQEAATSKGTNDKKIIKCIIARKARKNNDKRLFIRMRTKISKILCMYSTWPRR